MLTILILIDNTFPMNRHTTRLFDNFDNKD